MNILIREPYLVLLPRSLRYKEEFGDFLRERIREKILFKLNIIFQVGDTKRRHIVFKLWDLPAVSLSSDKTSFINSNIEQVISGTSLLQKLNPINSEDLEIEGDIFVFVNNIIDSMFSFEILLDENSRGFFFGVEESQLYEDTIFPIVYLMRILDFGNMEVEPFYIFYPEFLDIRANLTKYYEVFLERRDRDANNRQLQRRSKRIHQKAIRQHSLGKPLRSI